MANEDYLMQAITGALEGFAGVYVPRKQKEFEFNLQRQGKRQDLQDELSKEKELLPLKSEYELNKMRTEDYFRRGQSEYESKLATERDAAKAEKEAGIKVPIIDDKGNTIGYTSKGAVKVGEGKAPTEGQTNANTYATRMEQAEGVINKLAPYINKFPDQGLVGGAKYAALGVAPDMFNKYKGNEYQSYQQAQRNFMSAVLRKESGAMISDKEMADGKVQYFPIPGDSNEVLAQKAANRKAAIEGIKGAAGKAYKPFGAPQVGGSDSNGSGEVRRKTADNKIAIFDSKTKKFLRYE